MIWFLRLWISFATITLSEASTLVPPVLPLVIRNPYLSVWLANAREEPWSSWPMFYEGQNIGLSVLASVPHSGNVYPLLGRPQDSLDSTATDEYNITYPSYLGAQFDASTTNLSYSIPCWTGEANPVEITLSFLSPITPTSTLRQSIPAAYLSVHVKGTFDVDIYVDLNGQWVSGDRGSQITWDLGWFLKDEKHHQRRPVLKTWKVKRETEQLFTEYGDQAEWGSLYFSAPMDMRHAAGASAVLRQRFARTGTLHDHIDRYYRSIMDEEPVFAYAKSFKLNGSWAQSTKQHDSVLFTIAHVQDPVIQFAAARGLTLMKPLWASWFHNPELLLMFHYLDFAVAATLATNYSNQLALDGARTGSEEYKDILALSARQVIGATSFSGTADNPLIFLKEISSDGNTQTIDVIYPSFPFFLYTNPRWLAYLLEPLIEHMLSGQYPNTYAMHDLGANFPNATGHPDGNDEYMPVEECGNILIMGLALANSLIYNNDSTSSSMWGSLPESEYTEADGESVFPLSNLEMRDGIVGLDDRWGGIENGKGRRQASRYLRKSYQLWKQWTGYLVEFTLTPATQLSTDDFAGWLANQTNLALKGIIGIKAMSEIAELVENTADAEYYKKTSSIYIRKWEEYGLSRDGTHAKLAYNWFGSWTILYNLFADALLCFHISDSATATSSLEPTAHGRKQTPLNPGKGDRRSKTNFVKDHIYQMQSNWYHNVIQKYGLPLDSRHLYTKSDWEFFAAAVASKHVRQEIIQAVALWVNETTTDRPLTDLYDTEGDGWYGGPAFKARPVVGGHFAFLALERACDGKAVPALGFLDEAQGVKQEGAMEVEREAKQAVEQELDLEL